MKIVIADDSAIVRAILEQRLKREKDIEILDSVSNGRKALDIALRTEVDLVLLDSDMPEMDGYEAAKLLKKEHIPVIIFAEDSASEIKATSINAGIVIHKPRPNEYNELFYENLISNIQSLASKVEHKQSRNFSEENSDDSSFKIVCIGASTGGPTAVAKVLQGLGDNFPLPILYAQHIEVGADQKMASWLNETCSNITVKLAEDEEIAKPGVVYMAPADKHIVIGYLKSDGIPVIKLSSDPPVRFLRPAVDKLFLSATSFYSRNLLAILLTGMGRDGADSCKTIIENGGYTIVEDESTCAVFGMPAAAIEVGGATEVLPRNEIAGRILKLVNGV